MHHSKENGLKIKDKKIRIKDFPFAESSIPGIQVWWVFLGFTKGEWYFI